ncbi:MAG TPA: SDR family oxidoreductase [Acidimicrobiia bacterium]|nr:SDR family oxidoreductase [Acidimicrobiia bacterium]
MNPVPGRRSRSGPPDHEVAIVTGGASGIGRSVASELFRGGAHVLLADVDFAAATATADALRGDATDGGGSVAATALDVRDLAAVHALVDDVITRYGRLDYLFNNAGISMGGLSHEMDAAAWGRTIDVNLGGAVNGVLAAYPRMIDQGFGHIVNTASAAGLAPTVMALAYATTKHAVVGLSTTLRPEAALHGVRVSALCPGAVDTPILDHEDLADLPSRPRSLTGREYMAMVGLKPMSPDVFARRALRGVRRNRAVIVVPGNVRALWYLQRIAPWLVERVGRRTARRIMERSGEFS